MTVGDCAWHFAWVGLTLVPASRSRTCITQPITLITRDQTHKVSNTLKHPLYFIWWSHRCASRVVHEAGRAPLSLGTGVLSCCY